MRQTGLANKHHRQHPGSMVDYYYWSVGPEDGLLASAPDIPSAPVLYDGSRGGGYWLELSSGRSSTLSMQRRVAPIQF